MTDMTTWILDNSDRIYRYWVHKRMFTPAEVEAKYTDQSCYECEYCLFGLIEEAIELPDGDVLLGFVDPNNFGSSAEGCITYHKLSQVDLMFYPDDTKRFLEGDDLYEL